MGVLMSIPAAFMSAGSFMLAAPLAALSAFCCCCQGISCICSTVNILTCCFRGSLGRRTGVSPRLAKIFYIIILGLATILAIILRFNATQLDLGALTFSCSGGNTSITAYGLSEGTFVYCRGDAAVFRISFILTLFFSVMMFCSLCSEGAHRGYWFLKIVLICGGIAGAFFMPNTAFDNQGYAWVARIGSFVFLILQILVLIDFAYQWNEDWVERAYSDPMNTEQLTNKKWLYGVLVSAGGLYATSITGIALQYVFYGSCQIGMAFNTVTVLAVALVTALSLFREQIIGEPGAILPAAVVSSYIVFLCWGALESNPDATCKPPFPQTAVSIAIGAVWATITLLWTTFSLTNNAGHLVKGEELEKPPEPAVPDPEAGNPSSGGPVTQSKPPTGGPVYREDLNQPVTVSPEDDADQDDSPVYSPERPWTFHLIMVCASMYVAMLLTDWGTFTGGSASFTIGEASMWVKITAQWLTIILFTWTLIVPAVLKNREFS